MTVRVKAHTENGWEEITIEELVRRYENQRISLMNWGDDKARCIKALQILKDGFLTEETDSLGDKYVTMSFIDREWLEVCNLWAELFE